MRHARSRHRKRGEPTCLACREAHRQAVARREKAHTEAAFAAIGAPQYPSQRSKRLAGVS